MHIFLFCVAFNHKDIEIVEIAAHLQIINVWMVALRFREDVLVTKLVNHVWLDRDAPNAKRRNRAGKCSNLAIRRANPNG